jgi:hypothetical protein
MALRLVGDYSWTQARPSCRRERILGYWSVMDWPIAIESRRVDGVLSDLGSEAWVFVLDESV